MPRKKPRPIAESIALHAGRPCKADGCDLPMWRIGSYCEYHTRFRKDYGHPHGRWIVPREYANERQEVKEFLKQNLSHPGVVSGLAWIDEWMNMTISDDPVERAKQPVGIDTMNRLRAHDVTPLDVINEVTALWMLSYRFPSKLPDDIRLTYAVSRAVYKLAPSHKRQSWTSGKVRETRPSAVELAGIGSRIRDVLGLLVVNIIQTIHARQAAKASIKQNFAAPFDVPLSYTLKDGAL